MGEIGWGDNTCVAKLEFDENGNIDVVYENDASHFAAGILHVCVHWLDEYQGYSGVAADLDSAALTQRIHRMWIKLWDSCVSCIGMPTARMQTSIQDALIRDVERAQKVSPRACTFGCLESRGRGRARLPENLVGGAAGDPVWSAASAFAGDYRGCGLSGQILGQAISVYRALGKRELCARVAEKNYAMHRVLS